MGSGPFAAIILAGGFSSRMGTLKPLLDLGGKPALQRAAESLRSAGIQDIRVVVGHAAERLDPLLSSLGLRRIINPDYGLGMFTSVRAGVRTLNDSIEGFFLLPADIPLIRPSTFRCLMDARAGSEAPVIYPTFASRRGHPPLLDARCIKEIAAADPTDNLRSILERHAAAALAVECADAAIHMDMDTQEDYERLRQHLRWAEIPSPEECRALLRIRGASESVVRHGTTGAELGKRIPSTIDPSSDANLDPDALEAALILHDIAKDSGDPASAAAIVRESGFPRVADIITRLYSIGGGTRDGR